MYLHPAAQPAGIGIRLAHDPGDPLITSHCPFCGSGQVIGRSDGTIECDFCGQNYIVRVQPAFPGSPQAPAGPGAPSDIGPDGGVLPPDALPPDGDPGEMPPGGDEAAGGGFPPDDEEDGEGPPPDDEGDDPGAADDDGPPPPPSKGKSKKKGAKVRRCKHQSGDGGPCGMTITQDGSGGWRHDDSTIDSDHDAQPWWSAEASRGPRYRIAGGTEWLDEDQYVRHLAASLSGHDPRVMAEIRARQNRARHGRPGGIL